jgi:hypothetical protein
MALTSLLAPTVPATTGLPELWILSIVKSGKFVDVPSAYSAMRVPAERAVVVSEYPLHFHRRTAENPVILGAYRDSMLWNAGLDHIAAQQPADAIWDVLLLDPTAPLPLRHADSLRHHMRTLDVWMAEPDLFDVIGPRAHQTFFGNEPDQAHPSAVVVSGEMKVRFDPRVYDGADAWADYCRRTRYVGGSVLVSTTALREHVS